LQVLAAALADGIGQLSTGIIDLSAGR